MKKTGFLIFVLSILAFFLLFPEAAISASKRGLSLWFEQLVPVLLPFSILSGIVLSSHLFEGRPKKKQGFLCPLECYIICCGFLFGFPIGSKLAADSYREGKISKKHAEILSCFTNNLSPVFIVSVWKKQLMLPGEGIAFLLLYGIPFVLGMLALYRQKEALPEQKKSASRFQLNMQIVDAGIMNGFTTLIRICGYVMLFSIISQMFLLLPLGNELTRLLLTGGTEVTNGLQLLAESNLNAGAKRFLATLFLSWNGLSGFFQTASILRQEKLPIMYYLKTKLLYLILAGIGALLFSGIF